MLRLLAADYVLSKPVEAMEYARRYGLAVLVFCVLLATLLFASKADDGVAG